LSLIDCSLAATDFSLTFRIVSLLNQVCSTRKKR
jgi:hypothetical protein